MTELLADHGNLDRLRAQVDAGNLSASQRLVELLMDQDRDEAMRVFQLGLNPDGPTAGHEGKQRIIRGRYWHGHLAA